MGKVGTEMASAGDGAGAAGGRPGQIVFLNGTSSSGTTSLARAVQDAMATPYLHPSLDHFLQRLPRVRADFDPTAGGAARRRAGCSPFHDHALVGRRRLGPVALRLLTGMYQAIGALATAGVGVVVDDVIYDARVLRAAVHALAALPALFVAVRCPLAVAEQRERARGDRAPGGARVFHGLVHPLVATHGRYDLEIDTRGLQPPGRHRPHPGGAP